ncbi:MAG: YggS family pyridoxal phosphate-dependent enzyme [Saprospiraceae bacterium]
MNFINWDRENLVKIKFRNWVPKHESLPDDIKWHFIGHLQKNKVKYIAPFVFLIHSVDSIELIEEINKRAKSNDRVIKFLLEVKIAKEDSKFGLNFNDCENIIKEIKKNNYSNVELNGVMGMATYTDNEKQIEEEFSSLHTFFNKIKEIYFPETHAFSTISMGMSGDYKIALENGATLVRIGSLILGNR